jgi:hypothetical protein
MESLTRLVSESLARHGFDRPVDYRRLQWSRWFRCQSHHSLLLVPSRPGVFALAEEIADFDGKTAEADSYRGAASAVPKEGFQTEAALAAVKTQTSPRRMLAVTQFFEDDDMAFVLDRMLSQNNPMRARLASGRYFVRYVVISDESQRRSVGAALNQWIASQVIGSPAVTTPAPANASEKMSGIGPHFAASLELTPATEYVPPSASLQVAASAVPREAFSYRSGLGR